MSCDYCVLQWPLAQFVRSRCPCTIHGLLYTVYLTCPYSHHWCQINWMVYIYISLFYSWWHSMCFTVQFIAIHTHSHTVHLWAALFLWGAIQGSVSCPRTLRHADGEDWDRTINLLFPLSRPLYLLFKKKDFMINMNMTTITVNFV